MSEIINSINTMPINDMVAKLDMVNTIEQLAESEGYTIVERNDKKPWGAYLRLDGTNADKFVEEFFPGLPPRRNPKCLGC